MRIDFILATTLIAALSACSSDPASDNTQSGGATTNTATGGSTGGTSTSGGTSALGGTGGGTTTGATSGVGGTSGTGGETSDVGGTGGDPSTGGASGGQVGCTRQGLIAAADTMVASLEANDPSQMPTAASLRYTENASETSLGDSIWQVAGPIDQARHLIDVEQCSSFTEIIITDAAHPYVLGVRLTLEDEAIAELEAVVTDEGDWAFSATGYLNCSEPQDWGELDSSERVPRTELTAAANAYLDLFADATVQVPWDEASCSRLEGGGSFNGSGCQYTGEAQSNLCNMGIPDGLTIGARRYYMDEETGSIVVICLFGGETVGMLDTHLFRIESGLIHYIHTLSVDGNQGQGTGW